MERGLSSGGPGEGREAAVQDLAAAAAEVAGTLAEHGIGEVVVDGVALRSREGVDLPGVLVRAVEGRGAAVVAIGKGRGEIVLEQGRVRWRGCDEALAAALERALGAG